LSIIPANVSCDVSRLPFEKLSEKNFQLKLKMGHTKFKKKTLKSFKLLNILCNTFIPTLIVISL
jgi:hypothetical protein